MLICTCWSNWGICHLVHVRWRPVPTRRWLERPKLECSAAAWNPLSTPVDKLTPLNLFRGRRLVLSPTTSTEWSVLLLYRQDLQWDSLATCRLYHQCCMFYKIKHELVNIPFQAVFPSHRTSRMFNKCYYQIIQSRVNSFKYSLFVYTIPVWNMLPASV